MRENFSSRSNLGTDCDPRQALEVTSPEERGLSGPDGRGPEGADDSERSAVDRSVRNRLGGASGVDGFDAKDGLALLVELNRQGQISLAGEVALKLSSSVPDSGWEASLVQQCLMSAGFLCESVAFAERAAERHPECSEIYHNMGAALRDLGRFDEALSAFRAAVASNPCSDLSLTMAGVVLKDLGRLDEAIEFHGAAIRMNPRSAIGFYNLGNALLEREEPEGAVTAYRRALEIRPDWPELLNNFSIVLSRLDRHAEAIPILLSLCKIQRDSDANLGRLAVALREANRPAEAMELAEFLVTKEPANRNYRMLRGACLVRLGRAEEAVREYTRAAALDVSDLECCSSMIYAANYLPYEHPEELFSFYREFGRRAATFNPSSHCEKAELKPFPRKLRIGYVSGDFCHHPVTTFIEPVLREHDRSAFEIYCYYNHSRVDPFTRRLQALPLHWRDVRGLSDAAFCERVQSDGVDILVDLSGHTARNRLTAFARKPARIQMTMVGCMQTTGLETVDYRITDAWLDPVGLTEAYHSERLVRMNSGAVCFRAHPSAPEVSPVPCLQGAPFTFGSYNNIAKITTPVLDLWAAILTGAPESRMQVVADSEDHFLREMGKRGIAKHRFIILRRMKEVEYLESHASVDLLLDTFPFNGLTITSNALWMGVPCVTLSGNTSASRAGTSLQKRLGLELFVTSTPGEYLRVALHFAANPSELEPVRACLREKMRKKWSDSIGYTRELEDVFRRVWQDSTGQEVLAPPPSEALAPQAGEGLSGSVPTEKGDGSFGQPGRSLTETHTDPADGREDPSGREDFFSKLSRFASAPVPSENERAELLKFTELQEDARDQLRAAMEALLVDPAKWRQTAVCGMLLSRAGMSEEASVCFETAKKGPVSAVEWAWFSDELMHSGRFLEAAESLKMAAAQNDVRATHLTALGILLSQLGDINSAEPFLRRAISLSPSMKEAYSGLADCLYRKGDFRGALNIAEPIFRLSEDRKELLNLAAYHEKSGSVVQAIEYLQRSLEKTPDDAAAYVNLGSCFLLLGMADAAVSCLKKSIEIAPDAAWMYSNMLCTLTYSADFDQATVYAMHREFARKFEAPLLPHTPHSHSRDPKRRLRIAYVSPDFRAHSVSFFVEPMLKHHDRSSFEVFGVPSYSWKDGITDRIKSECDQWIDAANMTDEELAQALRDAEIDIVVDLICHSNHSRVLAFARKPAPIQITMIGMQQTTGLDSMDYRVTDAFMDPPGLTEAFHSEKLIRLPVALVFEPPFSAPAVGPLPALRNGFVTFGSFNNFAKVNDAVRDAWIRVLKAVPNSRFVCVLPTGTGFERELREAGIEADRVTFTPRLLIDPYLETHHQIDFILDTFPFAGLTVSAIAAWMGVPTLTIAGKTSAARAGASIQHCLGLDEFIARDPDDFVAKAVQLAGDWDHLARVRASMRDRMAVQFTNAPAYMRSFESALRQAWRDWCARPSGEAAVE